MNFEISKQTSLILKGIGAILIVATHLLGVSNSYLISIPLCSANMAYYLSLFARMCVYIFAFISGYGLFYSFTKYKDKPLSYKVLSIIKKILVFLIGYWLILLTLFLPFYIASGSWNTKDFFLSLFGLSGINMYSWYVYFYIIVLITLPLLHLLLRKHWSIPIIFIVLFVGLYFVLRAFQSKIPYYDSIVNCVFAYISVLIGYAFARDSYLTKLVNLVKQKRWIIIVSSLVLTFGIFAIYCKWTYGIIMPFMSMFFVIAISLLFTYNVPKWITKPFMILGECSMFIWFAHAIVLTPYINQIVNFEWFFYLPREAVCVVIFTLIILTPICYLYHFVHIKISSLLKFPKEETQNIVKQ